VIPSLRAAARTKPVVVLKAGRSLESKREPTADAVFDAALTRAGTVRVQTYAQLFAAARILAVGRITDRVVPVNGQPAVQPYEAVKNVVTNRVRQQNAMDRIEVLRKAAKVDFPQVCDGRGWQSELALRYHIETVPTFLVIDKDGKHMMDGGGTMLAGSDGAFIGPGHAGILPGRGPSFSGLFICTSVHDQLQPLHSTVAAEHLVFASPAGGRTAPIADFACDIPASRND